MKLAKITLEDFRHLGTSSQPLELSFTDALGRVRDFTLLVGPNTSGKTTILDAIALALGRSVSMAALRPDFKVSPRTVVRRGALHAPALEDGDATGVEELEDLGGDRRRSRDRLVDVAAERQAARAQLKVRDRQAILVRLRRDLPLHELRRRVGRRHRPGVTCICLLQQFRQLWMKVKAVGYAYQPICKFGDFLARQAGVHFIFRVVLAVDVRIPITRQLS